MAETQRSDAPAGEMLDYDRQVGGFVLVGPEGRLVALAGFRVARDFSRIQPRPLGVDLRAMEPFVVDTRPSSLVLVIHPGERAHAYFLLDTTIAGAQRSVKVFQNTAEIINDALDSDRFPVLLLDDLRRAAVRSRQRRSPLTVRVHYLELRPSLPEDWRRAARDVFAANAESPHDKAGVLEERLSVLRREVRTTMFRRYLSQCIWFDPATGLLGRISPSRMNLTDERYGFSPFLGGDAQMGDFVRSLAKDTDGRLASTGGFANVLPTPVRGREWTSPTLHVHDADFRDRYGLEEYYSLYRGLEALCELGAPVLVYDPRTLDSAIAVRLLRPSASGGPLVIASVRDFALRGLLQRR